MHPKTVCKIVKSHHPTPKIIENDKGYITPVYIVIPRKYNIWTHIIPPYSTQPISMEKQKLVVSLRLPIIPHKTPVLTPRVPTSRHQYNIQPRMKLAYYCIQTGKLSLAANIITYMEANDVIHPITWLSQEYRHLITGEDKFIWKRSFTNRLGHLTQVIRGIKVTNTVFFISNHEVPFTTKKSHVEKLRII